MIRQQQQQILSLQTQNTSHGSTSAVAIDDSTPTSERSMSLNHAPSITQPHTSSASSAAPAPRSRSPFVSHSLSRHSSYRSSRDASPSLRPVSGHGASYPDNNELSLNQSASRDESAFYQAETQMLTRENQMLKMRIRELGMSLYMRMPCTVADFRTERQLNPNYPSTHSPATTSNLVLESTNVHSNGESASAAAHDDSTTAQEPAAPST
jgi:hypothetical protein